LTGDGPAGLDVDKDLLIAARGLDEPKSAFIVPSLDDSFEAHRYFRAF
jgi:hypothetical protein